MDEYNHIDVGQHLGSNNRIIRLIKNRLELGNKTFKKEMPTDGTYKMIESVEECLDLALYLAAKIIELKDKEDAK